MRHHVTRLTVTNTKGDTDGDSDYDQLYVFGARSFSIWGLNPNGSNPALTQAYDSANDLEVRTATGEVGRITC